MPVTLQLSTPNGENFISLSFSIGTDSARCRQQTLETSLFAFLFLTVHRAADLLVKFFFLSARSVPLTIFTNKH